MRKVYLYLAEGFEEIEAISVVDVLRRAKIDVETISLTGNKEVSGAHNISIIADKVFEEADYSICDMIVLPGGMPGTINLEKHEGLVKNIINFNQQGKWIAAICAAPSILGKLDLLSGKSATCYPGFEEALKGAMISSKSVVVCDKIITSRGPGTALSFALKIVEVLVNEELSREIEMGML